ncbi:interferon-induced very large GTPase 1-like [Hyperolius riggenbachi]|uniref:interferon-induced very large GTPase 1-like n=1 Tax=Hyperolius riggenbachi TaxID=752182 RepID=UPI0035A35D38
MCKALKIPAQCLLPPKKMENFTDAEVIRHASGGLALEGIFQTKNMEDVVRKREPVLYIPENVSLAGKEHSSVVREEEFLSPKKERDFQKAIERLGMNLWRSVFVPLMQCGLNCEYGLESEPNYVCATRYNYIPLASCYIRRDQLRISQSALSALKDIEKEIYVQADDQDLGRKCKTFFHRFGSHVHFGPIHFGGIYWWKVSVTEDDPRQIEKAKQAVFNALNSYEDASCAGYREDTDFLTTAQGRVDFSKTSNFQKHIQVSISKTGGPSNAASFLQWKSGLQSSKETWSVIDRGYQLVPIWTVIKDNHKDEFTDNFKIASCLSNHYERLTGLTTEKSLKNSIEKAKGFLWYVQFWNVDSTEDHVSASTDLKQELFEMTGADNIWENICLSDKNLQTFLKRVVQKYIDTPEEHTQLIRTSMKALLDPHIFSVKNFPDTIFIMNWINRYEKKVDFKKFMQVLNKYVQNLKVTSHLTIEDQHKMNCLLNLYLIALRNKNDLEEELLMLCIAINFEYFSENHSFQRPLEYKEIEYLRNQMQGTYNEFMDIRCKCTKRAQAFVLYRGLTSVGPNNVSLEWKAQRLDFMKEHLRGRLCNDICKLIGHGLPSTQEEWNKIEKDLKDYIYGTMGKDISWLLKKLDLEEYYPQKMKIMDVRKICLSYLAEKHDFEEKQLPLHYLQKLLMLDYNAKYAQCAQSSHLTAQADGGEDVIDIFPHGNMQKYEQQNEQAIHPMDVQMSVFHCADDFMRQYLYSKLSICQFALPLLVPLPNSIEFPLWSFQEIKKKWKKKCKCDTPYDKVIKKTKTHIVSFIRLGQSSSSKSQLMNWLISKQKHNIFFHRHCRGSTNNALLMNGVTEIAWYFPGGKEDDPFDDCIAFTNLHGDAKEQHQQVKFLEEISSVIVVVFSELDPRGKEVLQRLQKSPKSLICLLANKEKCPPGEGNKINIGLKKRNEAEMIQDISQTIQSLLSISKKEYSLDTCADVARKHGFVVDEDKTQCKQGKEDAQGLTSLLKAKETSVWKEAFLPLQGELWKDWCKTYKELKILKHNSQLDMEQQQRNIESKKRAIWNELIKRAFPPNNFMKDFLDYLRSNNQESNMYFLQWLKTYLNDFSSTLSVLKENYYSKLSQIMEKKKDTNTDKTIIETMEHDLEKLSKNIDISTFGLENILRELGHIYEASETLLKKDRCFFTLPKIAAELMVSGYPIELMDGDAAHVPRKWIGSILDELMKTLGDKKLYVLTVLGIQSTGKSTLLSALFGLQSAVGAGRGTRGAFMQLIKVDEQLRQELHFDYVLIIDTEGLRAAELPTKTTIDDHDKELATFVIGLSNLSLINICGENPSEIQYILQIAIQAFLRMKEVPLRPSCVLVHQNVGEITAEENLKKKRHLQDKLDEMTLYVAQQEKCDSTCFRDVVRFDINTHTHFLAPLSEGDPPMSSPNPSYSQNIQQLRQDILETAKQEEKQNIVCISTFMTQINDRWHDLLSKDRSILVHKKLDAKYSQWTWELRERMLTLQNKIIYQIHNHGLKEWEFPQDPESELIYKGILKELEAFFDDEKNKKVKALCKVEKMIERLTVLKNDIIKQVKKNADEFIAFEKNRKKYEDKMLAGVRNLALSLKGKNITDIKLRKIFDKLWNTLITEVKEDIKKDYTFEKPNINNDLEKEFLEMFKNKKNIRSTIEESCKWENLVEEFSKYISNKSKMVVLHQKLSKADVETIQHITDVLERKLEEFLHNKEQKRMDYQPIYFWEIVEMLITEIDEGLGNFKFRRQYMLYASLFFCHKATKRFENMFEVCRAANDMVDFLLKKNNEFWQICKMLCNGTMDDFLCIKLEKAIKEAVYHKSAIDLASKVKCKHQALNRNKSKLDFYLLKSLAEKEIFSKYMYYIRDPKSAVRDFIKECVGQYCDDYRNVAPEILNLNLDHFKNITLKAINNTSATLVRGKKDGVKEWLDTFCSQLGSEVKLSRDDLWSVTYLNITDVESLKEAMKQAVETVVQKRDHTDLTKNVSRIIFDHFSGCWKKCPFCCAVCTRTICKHDEDHSATCHRPQALNGWHYRKTDQFVVESCESLVETNINFRLPIDRSIPYKIFEQAGNPFSTWSITPSKPELSYWKWVTHHFQSDLVKHYKYKFTELGTIPAQWRTINKEEAIEELRKYLKKDNYDNMVNGNL